MNPTQTLQYFARRLQSQQRGAVALTFLMTSGIMIMGTLGAIDLARYNIAQSRLQNAVDATAISAGQALGSWDPAVSSDKTAWENYTGAFFAANMPDGYLNSDITSDTIKAGLQYCTADPSGVMACPSLALAGTPVSAQYVNINADGALPLISVGFLKVASLPLAADNQVIRRLKDHTEIVLALEDSKYTGATSNAKIQEAAKELVAAALGSMNLDDSAGTQGIRVGVVPFSAMVRMNPGGEDTDTPNAKSWVNGVATQLSVNPYVQSGNWLGCISEPYPPNTVGSYWGQNGNPILPATKRTPPNPDDSSDINSFQPVFMPLPATSKNYGKLGAFIIVDNNKDITIRETGTGRLVTIKKSNKDDPTEKLIPSGAAIPAPGDETNYRFIGMDTFATWSNLSPIVYSAFEPVSCAMVGRTQFLSQSTNTLDAAINTMWGWEKSESLIPGGLLWAWRMLAPEWSTDAAGSGNGWDDFQPSLPADPTNTDASKPMVNGRAVILVSTGVNSTAVSDSTYDAPHMYNPPSNPQGMPGPVQQSHFQMEVNYCNDGTIDPVLDEYKVAKSCSNGSLLQTGIITSWVQDGILQTAGIVEGASPVGNRGGQHGGMDQLQTIGIWPATSLINLDMRNLVSVRKLFENVKLVGSNAISSFQDPNATIGWPAGTTSGFTVDSAKAYMLAVCDAIKSDNPAYPIHLYTVFLGGGDKDAMGSCASGPAYAFESEDINNLRSTFAAILGSMTELRLTE